MIDTPIGEFARRIELPHGVDCARLLDRLRKSPNVADVVITETHACVHLVTADPKPFVWPPLPLGRGVTGGGREHRISIRYDGEDLAEIAEHTSLSKDEVIAIHQEGIYEVRWLGFLPGFAYLGDLDPRLQLGRRKTPRNRVPKGAVGVASRFTGIYPHASPGGWHLVGTTSESVFDVATGARFALGDRIRFVAS